MTIVFWVCLLLIMIPVGIFGWMLLSARMDSGSPIFGDRYKNDLNPSITKSDLANVKTAAAKVDGVDSVKVELATATLRVYADIADDADAETAKAVAGEIYSAVTDVLDPSVYFSQHDDMKMYDMEIHVYNLSKDRDSDAFVYVIETRTSSMDEPVTQLVSEPIDAELAQQLRDDVEARNNPQPAAQDTAEATAEG